MRDTRACGRQKTIIVSARHAAARLFVFFLCFPLALLPRYANAGVFSFVAGLFSPENSLSSEDSERVSVQNVALLAAAVNPDPNPAKGGGDITIVGGAALLPETGPAGTMANIEENSAGTISRYVVREGDTLGAIAKMFGVSVNTIVWANNIRGGLIRPGDELIILPISGVRHVVAKGDTLGSIAKRYKADLNEIVQFNGLAHADAPLAVGDEVIIPDGEIAPLAGSLARVSTPLRGESGLAYEGYYMRPIIGGRKTQGLHGYNGVDLATYRGAPVLASAPGAVIIARSSGWNGGYGVYIVIAHPNGTQTLYSHLSGIIAYEGKRVERGEIIGYVGSTGRSTGPHLHFEVRGAKNPF